MRRFNLRRTCKREQRRRHVWSWRILWKADRRCHSLRREEDRRPEEQDSSWGRISPQLSSSSLLAVSMTLLLSGKTRVTAVMSERRRHGTFEWTTSVSVCVAIVFCNYYYYYENYYKFNLFFYYLWLSPNERVYGLLALSDVNFRISFHNIYHFSKILKSSIVLSINKKDIMSEKKFHINIKDLNNICKRFESIHLLSIGFKLKVRTDPHFDP